MSPGVIALCVAVSLAASIGYDVATSPREIAPEGTSKPVMLFTQDGCTVYRFVDYGAARYFMSCSPSGNKHNQLLRKA